MMAQYRKQFGVQYLAQGHFDILTVESLIELGTF